MTFIAEPQSSGASRGAASEEDIIASVQNALQPDIQRRLAARKRLDDMAVKTLLEHVNVLSHQMNNSAESPQNR